MKHQQIINELKSHAPFTALGTAAGIAIMLVLLSSSVPREVSANWFWTMHPLHVLISAFATAAMYRRHSRRNLWMTFLVGYVGSVGIATFSDSLIPYAGELLLDLPHRHVHLGFIEKWWLVNPLALLGITLAWFRPHTRLPHFGHVLFSTLASMFHMAMAMGPAAEPVTIALSAVFLFLAVWLPCCTSDIVFPLLWSKDTGTAADHHH